MSPSHSVTGYGAPVQAVTVQAVLSAAEADVTCRSDTSSCPLATLLAAGHAVIWGACLHIDCMAQWERL